LLGCACKGPFAGGDSSSTPKYGTSVLDDNAKTASISGVILKMLGIRILAPDECQTCTCRVSQDGLTGVAKTYESIPHEWVQLKGLHVALNSLFRIIMSVPQFALQTVYRCGIRKMLSLRFGVLVYVIIAHQLIRSHSK